MSHFIVLIIIVAVFAASVTCLPMDTEAFVADLLPPKIGIVPTLAVNFASKYENGPVPAMSSEPDNRKMIVTDTARSSLPGKMNDEKMLTSLFLINFVAVKNGTGKDLNDVLHNDVIKLLPTEIGDEDEKVPMSLDEVAKDLQEESFAVKKVVKDGETLLIKVDLDSIKATEEIPNKNNDASNIHDENIDIQDFDQLASIRRKRNACLKCTIIIKQDNPNRGRKGGHKGGQRGGCRGPGGCGGGGGARPVQPVYQPVYQVVYQYQYPQSYYQPSQQQHYPQPQQQYYPQPQPQQQYYPQPQPQQHYYPQPQTCNTCNGGYGNGGSNAYAQASAQASASSSSGSLGR